MAYCTYVTRHPGPKSVPKSPSPTFRKLHSSCAGLLCIRIEKWCAYCLSNWFHHTLPSSALFFTYTLFLAYTSFYTCTLFWVETPIWKINALLNKVAEHLPTCWVLNVLFEIYIKISVVISILSINIYIQFRSTHELISHSIWFGTVPRCQTIVCIQFCVGLLSILPKT